MKKCRDGTMIFRRADDRPRRGSAAGKRRTKSAVASEVHVHDWAAECRRFVEALAPEQLTALAQTLGVRECALVDIRCGWASEADLRRLDAWGKDWDLGFPEGAFAFPESDGKGNIIGISFRALDGRKGAPKGAARGLLIPTNFPALPGPVSAVEGPSDVAAKLSIGLKAIGRPNNMSGAEHLADLLPDQETIIVGENDERLDDGGTARWPGRDGADSVASKLATAWGKPVSMAMPPKGFKDVRAWLNAHHVDLNDEAACQALGRELLEKLQFSTVQIQPSPLKLTFDIERTRNRAKATVKALVNNHVSHMDSVNLNDSKARARFAKELAAKDPRVTVEAIESELLKRAAGDAPEPDPKETRSRAELLAEQDVQTEALLQSMPADVVADAEAMLLDPKLINRIVEDIAEMGVVGERELALSIYLIGTSRLLEQPLAGITQGTSSSGKSHTQKVVSGVFPPESLLIATDISPMSLYYLPLGRLIHQFVVAGERHRNDGDENAHAKRALREMLSSGELSKVLPIKVGGKMESVVVRQFGPIAFIESTTQTEVFDEDMNRCLALGTDESPEQTRRIMDAICRRAMGSPASVKAIIQRHHALQRMLKRVNVVIPFADKIAKAMPNQRPEARRAISHILNMIQAIALLHQYQRLVVSPDHGDVIEATVQDYVVAHRLLTGPLGRALGGALPDAVANLGKRLFDRYGSASFTTSQAACDDPIITSRPKMSEYLNTLDRAGVVKCLEKGKGNKPAEWQNVGEVPEAGARWLPTIDAIQELQPCPTA